MGFMHYRAYFIDVHEHIRAASDIDAPSLQDARRLAEQRSFGWAAVELWQTDQIVSRFEPLARTTVAVQRG